MEPRFYKIDCPNPNPKTGTHAIALVEWGKPDNPNVLFCVHGLTRNARDFDFLAHAMEKEYRVISMDVVGRGKSDWFQNPKDYDYKHYFNDVFYIIRHLHLHGPGKRLDFVGTSMGGLIGMALAALHRTLFHRLVMNDIGPFIDKHALERIGSYVSDLPSFPDMQSVEQFFLKIYDPWGISDPKHIKHIVQHSTTQDEGGRIRLSFDPNISGAFQSAKGTVQIKKDVKLWLLWRRVKCPVLVLRGMESDILTHDTLKKMQKIHKPTDFYEFPKIGHAPSLMDNEQIRLVKDWLLGR